MKKHSLFKVLGIMLGLIIISSYFLANRNGTMAYIGIVDVFMKFLQSLYYFFYVIVFLLAVGGFYGVLNKTAAYKKLLDSISTKVKPLGKKFIFLLIILMAVITSFTGLTLPLIIFIPFIVSIVLLVGFDKLVALISTIGSIVVGYIGGVFVAFVNPNTGSFNTYETFVGLESQFDNMFPKLLLLFSGIALLITFVNLYITGVEKKKIKYELNDDTELMVNEVGADYKDIKTWPIVSVLLGLFILILLGLFPWNALFGITFFDEFHNVLVGLTMGDFIVRLIIALIVFGFVLLIKWIISLIRKRKFKFKVLLPIVAAVVVLLGLEVLNTVDVWNLYEVSFMETVQKFFSGSKFFDFPVLTNVISTDYLTAFGAWNANGDSLGYLLVTVLVMVASLVVALVNKVKFNDVLDEAANGIKKMIPTVILFAIVYTILIVSYTHGFFGAIVTGYGKFNYGVSSLLALLGSLLSVDFYYIVVGVFSPIIGLITDEAVYSSVAIMLQGIYGIFSLVGPTSLILIFGLSYFDVPYTTWLKFIWRLVLGLIILVALVTCLVVLL